MARHSLIELEAVLAIVRCGSFRAAALELGMSTTAISNAVGKLERELDVRLFNRTTRSVSLTEAFSQPDRQLSTPRRAGQARHRARLIGHPRCVG